jgi:hypothetical protein
MLGMSRGEIHFPRMLYENALKEFSRCEIRAEIARCIDESGKQQLFYTFEKKPKTLIDPLGSSFYLVTVSERWTGAPEFRLLVCGLTKRGYLLKPQKQADITVAETRRHHIQTHIRIPVSQFIPIRSWP